MNDRCVFVKYICPPSGRGVGGEGIERQTFTGSSIIPPGALMATLPPDAIAGLKQGDKIEAVKCVRAALGLGLKEAKVAVGAHAGESRRGTRPLVRESSCKPWWILSLIPAGGAVYSQGRSGVPPAE